MNWLKTLNESQLKAVVHEGGPLFVVAGAGTGKTKTLTSRIAYILLSKNDILKDSTVPLSILNMIPNEKYRMDANRILALTFTNKAAREMRDRVGKMTYPESKKMWLYTFHAFGLQILRRHINLLPYEYLLNFTVIDDEDCKKIVTDQIKDLGLDIKKYSAKAIRNVISLYKCKRIDAFEKDEEEKIYKRYREYLIQNQLVDFDDLLLYTLELFENNKEIREKYQTHFECILVDEFQDTDAIQYKVLKILAHNHKNIFVVGDPDQSIYGFRGASYENSRLFQKDFGPDIVVLDKNYRSTNQILASANQLIKNNFSRTTEKNLVSDLGFGETPIYHHAADDIKESYFVANEIRRLHSNGIPYNEMAILYRNNALSRLFEETLIRDGIPYIIYGGISFYERKEIKDAIAYVRIILNPDQDFFLKRIINVPRRSIGLVTIQKLEEKSRQLGISMFESIDYLDVAAGTKQSLLDFKKLVITMQSDFYVMDKLEQIIPYLINKTGYLEMLKAEGDEISADRLDNLKELHSVFTRGDEYYEGSFLEKITQQMDQIALYSDQDQDIDEKNHVILSTYHQVKGLEFKVVFMVAMEEGIFPGERALVGPPELEEERRVAYVGITRTKEKLYMSYAERRMVYGTTKFATLSRFAKEAKVITDVPKPIRVESVETQEYHLLKAGDKIEHSVFGLGMVVSVVDDIATIAFAMPHGIKKILESHPSLRKIRK